VSARYWIVPHTHWDREWYLTFQDFRWKLVRALDAIVETLRADPSFTHFMLDGQTVLLDDYLELRPERREELRSLVETGRLSAGPWYVQPDDILVTGEALIRNLERGLAGARALGRPMMVGYLPDSFGHIGSLPSILAGFGIGFAAFMRGPGPTLDKAFFEWTARDGSRVLVAYLIDGYGNGAELPMDAATIGSVLDELHRRQEGALISAVPLLVMNGIDHRSVDTALPGVLAAAGLHDDAVLGSLEEYMEASRGHLSDEIPRWTGELRSVHRCPITVGCTSVRHWIKREDQAISTLLERRAEPLAALASLLGAPYPREAIDLAWRHLLLNQPHDSICGCSIDPVHDDMRYRYAQARGLARNVVEDAARHIAGRLGTPSARGQAVVVLNPGPARRARAISFTVADMPAQPVLQNAAGELFRVQASTESGEPALFFDERFRPAQLRLAMGLVRNGEIMSYRIQNARATWESETVLRVDVMLAEGGASGFDWNAWIAETAPLLNRKGLTTVHAVGTRFGRKTVLFAALLPAFGAETFVLRSLGAGEEAPAAAALHAHARALENERYRVRVLGDGSLELFDKSSGQLYSRLGRLVDSGDRGDEYNYDPPPGDRIIDRPFRRLPLARALRTRLVEKGPVRATLRIEADYRVPAMLTPDRRGRSRRTTVIRTVRFVSLAAGASRVEIRAEVDNTACDHRLRAHFPLPGASAGSEAGGTFETVKRGSRPESLPPRPTRGGVASDLSQEQPAATHPFTGFVAAPWEDAPRGARGTLAVFSRGSREYEIVESRGRCELAVTLFRSVGWLSRADLVSRTGHAGMDIPTPGAQEQGRLSFEYALTTYGNVISELQDEWEDYRSPAEVVPHTAAIGGLEARLSLLDVEGSGLTFSSLTRTSFGWLSLRFFEHEGNAGAAILRCQFPARALRKTRLDGTPLRAIELAADHRSASVDVAPFEIVTLEIEPA
jgi:mannosylglycerate hydrolase